MIGELFDYIQMAICELYFRVSDLLNPQKENSEKSD